MKQLKGISVHETSENGMVELDILREMVDASVDLMWSVDKDFKLISANRAFKERVKEGRDALAIDLELIGFYERAFKGERFVTTEYTHEPTELWLEISFFPIIRNNEVALVACKSRDITAHKTETHRLELLESVVINTIDSVLITEALPLEGEGPRIVYVNDALTRMTGYTREEMIGRTLHMLYGPKSDTNEIARALKCVTNAQPCEIEIINYKKNGDEFWMHTSIAVISDGNGMPKHLISIGRDVTERVQNIDAIKKQNKTLRDIAWVQSHEVRGPLARIKGLLNLLCNHSHSEADAELLGYLNSEYYALDMVVKKIVLQTDEICGYIKEE